VSHVDASKGIRGRIIKITEETADGKKRIVVEVDEDCFCNGYYLWDQGPFTLKDRTWISLKHGNVSKRAIVTGHWGKNPIGVKIELA